MIKLRVYGTPVPQGSTRAFAVRKAGVPTGRVVVTGDNPKTKSWRQAVVDEAVGYLVGRDKANRCGLCDRLDAHVHGREPLTVTLTFILPRPANHLLTSKKSMGQVSPSAPPLPIGKPDLDKLCRAVLDALTDAGVWRDDSQVASLCAHKVYATAGERPGCVIEVTGRG